MAASPLCLAIRLLPALLWTVSRLNTAASVSFKFKV
jgi:hypothetical protein